MWNQEYSAFGAISEEHSKESSRERREMEESWLCHKWQEALR